jgi:mevalonate kinase
MSSIDSSGATSSFTCDLRDRERLSEVARAGGFWSYVCGTVLEVLDAYEGAGCDFRRGVVVSNYATTLPTKKGLSSSAAACVLIARCFNVLYSLGMTTTDEMALAFRGEAMRTPSACGAMDQACAFGGGRTVLLTFDKEGSMDVREVECKGDICILVGDLGRGKDTVTILASLQSAFKAGHEGALEAFGPKNEALMKRALDAISTGDARALGLVYTDAQRVFDAVGQELCPSELSAPALHAVLEDATCRALSFGGKGVGSQGDGCVQFVCKSLTAADALEEYLKSTYPSMGTFLRVSLGGAPK